MFDGLGGDVESSEVKAAKHKFGFKLDAFDSLLLCPWEQQI